MIIQVIVRDGGREGELVWSFNDDQYPRALVLYNSLVYAEHEKGLLLRDGDDEVWLKKRPGQKICRWKNFWQKILRL